MPLLWWCTVYSTLSIFRFPFISIFLPVFIKDQYEVSYEKKDLFSLSIVSSLLNFIPSPLFALSWIKHYHINDVIHKAHAELYFFCFASFILFWFSMYCVIHDGRRVCTCTLWMILFELQIAGQIRSNKYDITYIKRRGEGNKCMKNMQWAIISVPKTDGQTFLHKYRFIVRGAARFQNLIYQNIYSWWIICHFM